MPRESPFAIKLSRHERRELEQRVRRYTLPYFEVMRARIVLLAAEGWRSLSESVPQAATRGAELKRAPLIGRERALAPLLDTWHSCVRQRRTAVAVIEADAGMGKTRLTEELIARVSLDGAAAVAVRAVEADLTTPQSGLLAIARGGLLHAAGIVGAPTAALAAFAAMIPEWADRFPAPPETALPLGAALAEVLRAATAEQPMLVVADDAQWLDRESLLDLIATTRNAPESPLFLCFGITPQPARPELDNLRARLGRDLPGTAVTLGPLDVDSIERLAEWALPHYSDVELGRLARRLHVDSAGIPLLAVELLHAVALGLDLGRVAGAWPAPLKTLDQTLPGELPDAVVAAIRVGFRRLRREAQQALAAAAVLGDRVSPSQIAMGAALPEDALASALDELEWQRWLPAEPRGYSFVARIVRDVVAHDMVTAGQRRRIVDGAAVMRQDAHRPSPC